MSQVLTIEAVSAVFHVVEASEECREKLVGRDDHPLNSSFGWRKLSSQGELEASNRGLAEPHRPLTQHFFMAVLNEGVMVLEYQRAEVRDRKDDRRSLRDVDHGRVKARDANVTCTN